VEGDPIYDRGGERRKVPLSLLLRCRRGKENSDVHSNVREGEKALVSVDPREEEDGDGILLLSFGRRNDRRD